MKPKLTPEQRVRKELSDRLEEYKAGRTVMFRAIPEQEIGGLVIDILEALNANTEEQPLEKITGSLDELFDTPCPECGGEMKQRPDYRKCTCPTPMVRNRFCKIHGDIVEWEKLYCPTCGGEE